MMNQDNQKSSGLQVALQLWTVRALAEKNMAETLAEVAQIGYGAVEFAGFGTARVGDIHAALSTNGLKAVSAHVPYDQLITHPESVIEDLHVLGCNRVVVPAFAPHHFASIDNASRLADSLNALAMRFSRASLLFAYHNEDYDFAPIPGSTKTLWSALVNNTDPAFVELQLDVFTATAMNVNPIALMRDYGSRITSLHVCDSRGGRYVPIGHGDLNWRMLLEAASHTACTSLIVEHDAPPDPIADAQTSLQALKQIISR